MYILIVFYINIFNDQINQFKLNNFLHETGYIKHPAADCYKLRWQKAL